MRGKMNQSVKLSKAISYIVLICAALVFLAIWPLGIIHQTYVSKSNELIAMESDPVSVEKNVTQMFVAEGGELSAVDLYVCNDMRGETITFRLYDASYTEIFNTFHVVKDNQEFPGFVHIPVGFDLEKDQEYYFTLEGLSADMTVAYEERETSTSIVNGFMSYGGIEIQRFNVIIRYEYSNPFTVWQVLLSALVIAAVSAGILWLVRILFAKKLTDRDVKVQNVLRVTLNPIVVIGAGILCLMIFPGRKFGTGMLNYAFYGGSILLLMLLLLYYINAPRKGNSPLADISSLKEKMPDYIQAVAVSGMLWACYEYMNGLYDIHHAYAGCKQLFWLAVMLIATYTKKELWNIWNAVWAVAGIVVCYLFAKPYFGIPEQGELYTLGAYAIYAGGFVVINIIRTVILVLLKKQKPAKLNRAFLFPYAGLFVLLCAFKKSGWPVYATVLVGVLFFRMLFWEKREHFAENFCNGVILNFLAMVIFSWCHRPYHKYFYFRYYMGFHTVTMTGAYLTLILAAVVIKLFVKYRRMNDKTDIFPECALFGISAGFMIFTLSRTAFLATGLMGLGILILFVIFENKRGSRLRDFGRRVVIMLASVILGFPITFTLTRIVPAIVNDPITFEYEHRDYSIYKGTPSDSELYIDLPYFSEKFAIKVLGLFEDEVRINVPDTKFYLASVDNNLSAFIDTSLLLADAGEKNYSNGRIDIFKAYIADLNLTGHEVMDAEGTDAGHAHNIYLQVAHDQGLIVGIYFTVFLLGAIIYSFYYCVRNQKKNVYSAVIPAILLGFAFAGTVEWIFHPCNPFGISALMIMIPMLFKQGEV